MSGPIWPQYYRFGKQLWHRLLHNMVANRRKARNTMQRTCRTLAIAMGTKPWSQNPKRMQSPQIQCKIPAENWQITCRKLIIITNAHPKLRAIFFYFPNNVSCNKPQATKSGGGGVRATWRMRIMKRNCSVPLTEFRTVPLTEIRIPDRFRGMLQRRPTRRMLHDVII